MYEKFKKTETYFVDNGFVQYRRKMKSLDLRGHIDDNYTLEDLKNDVFFDNRVVIPEVGEKK